MSPFFCLWNPESPRAVSFTGSVFERLGEVPRSLAWADYLRGAALPEVGKGLGTIVRIESPGKNWAVEKGLLARGAACAVEPGLMGLDAAAAHSLEDDPGRIIASRQHHLGFMRCLEDIEKHFQNDGGGVRWMQHPQDIALMNDKAACQGLLAAAGVRVPRVLGIVSGFDDLMTRMDAARMNRVFLKLCHGSSASGTVALERSGGRMQAFTTARMEDTAEGGTLLRNWRQIFRHTDLRDIRRLVDAVCRHRAHAEAWLPKAGWRGRRFDVRVVVIGGRARQVVARLAEGPFTNLQFGARRASAAELREHVGAVNFAAMCAEAERAMGCFPRSLYGGVDVLLEARGHRPRVLEVNAFGDLLPYVLHEGRTTYDWEIEAALGR